MKCRKCEEKAVINMRAHKLALCKECYISWFQEYTEKTIKKFRMFTRDDKILIAASGGKDSLALWHVLTQLGYNVTAMYVNLGIHTQEYSDISKEKMLKMAEKLGSTAIIIDINDELGLTIPESKKLIQRNACSTCGVIKRYYMNKITAEGNFDVIATGHNLDDEVSSLFGNTLEWRLTYLKRQHPVLPEDSEGMLKRKVKPFCYFTEKQSLTYTLLNGIDFVRIECPYSKGATSIQYKEVMNQLEEKATGRKRRFYDHLLKSQEFINLEDEVTLVRCKKCDQPTTREVCSFCNIVEKINSIKKNNKSQIPNNK